MTDEALKEYVAARGRQRAAYNHVVYCERHDTELLGEAQDELSACQEEQAELAVQIADALVDERIAQELARAGGAPHG